MNRCVTITVLSTFLSLVMVLATSSGASASSIPLGHQRLVTLTRNVRVYKIHLTTPLSDSYSVASYTATKGSHYKLQHNGVNFEWTLNSGKFNSNSYYVYAISARGSNWFKLGTKAISSKKYKSFHGYRIEARKSLYTNNTFYYQKEHTTLSNYRPTQKSKVIFEFGSHVYPTNHEWDWVHGDYLTEYRYKRGSWHKIGTDYVGA